MRVTNYKLLQIHEEIGIVFCLDPLNSNFYNNYGIFPQYILARLIFGSFIAHF